MNQPRRLPRLTVNGVLLLDKPPGLSSNAALQSARRLYNAAKAGHTGTLDPLATGLLPLCFGEATKFAGELLEADKTYVATVCLGITTDTADAEGQVLATKAVNVSQTELEAVLRRFTGEIMMVPPMYSALKRDGKPLYEYARQGIELERSARRVTIQSIELHDFAGDLFSITVACSKGTYIRTLAEDVGAALGCGAHLTALRRIRIGRLQLEQAISLNELDLLLPQRRTELLLPVDALLDQLPCAKLEALDAARLGQGQAVRWNGAVGRWRAYAGETFLGLCELAADGWLYPRRLICNSVENTPANA